MAKILLLHPNFPGQFKHLAASAAKYGNDVKFLCQTHYERVIQGVERLKLKGIHGHEELKRVPLPLSEQSSKMAEQFRAGFVELKRKNWNPDVVISHSGWGCGFHVKEIWPDTRHVAYLEWWFNPKSDFFSYDTRNTNLALDERSIKKHWIRNQFISHELASSNCIVAPTFWQRDQLPKILKCNCHVIFDGLDIEIFKPNPSKKRNVPLITYGTRGMDPFRAFPQFIESLPAIIDELNGNVEIEIAGNSDVFYGSAPKDEKNWHIWATNFLEKKNIEQYVHWKGFLHGNDYVEWLQSSWCHVYLTHPFIASWSLVEALATGLTIVASDVETVRDICKDMNEIIYTDHRDSSNIATKVVDALGGISTLSEKSTRRDVSKYSVRESLAKWEAVTGVNLTTLD